MAAPYRGNTGHGVYFITACTFQKKNLLQSDRMAGLLVEVLLHYRAEGKYLVHEFVVMPDHVHLLLTPVVTLERALQFIKGGFSFAKGCPAIDSLRADLIAVRRGRHPVTTGLGQAQAWICAAS